MRIYVGGQKMRNASGQQAAASKLEKWKDSKQEHKQQNIFFHKMCNWISRCGRAKQRQRNVQKSVLHVQSC